MKPIYSIIIPSWNNPQFLNPCVKSILDLAFNSRGGEIIIVNNGSQPIEEAFGHLSNVKVLKPGKNLGWEGGLEYGLKYTDAEYVCFQNDDTHLPKVSWLFYEKLLIPFQDKKVAAVGPVTTCAMGAQSIFNPNCPVNAAQVPYLIFFTVMIKRKILDELGGIDKTLPGGDDLDLSMRINKAGYKTIINPDAFIIHHGFKTGERVRGDSSVAGGWNSKEMQERTNKALIQKNGFSTYFNTMQGGIHYPDRMKPDDLEGDRVRSFVIGENILDLGCGFTKTVPNAIGVDRVPTGDFIPHLAGGKSVANVIADVQGDLPFPELSQDCIIARHILEHCIDTIKTIKVWSKTLRIGGRLIIAVPDEDVISGIPLNAEHVHAFTPESLNRIIEMLGFKTVESKHSGNGISFVGCYEKVEHIVSRELVNA